MTETLLPPNATLLERALDLSTATRLEVIPRPVRSTANPDTIPAAWLPWLAWAWRVENWDTNWPEEQKRTAIKASWNVHRRKGTIGSMREALGTLDIVINVVEWFEDMPKGPPYTFRIQLTPNSGGISDSELKTLMEIINTTKNVRSHMSSVDVNDANECTAYEGAAYASGVMMDIPSDSDSCTFNAGASACGIILNLGA